MPRVPRTVLGFAAINLCTYALDLGILSLAHDVWGWPAGLAVTAGYSVAFALSFVLNRRFNFRSHAPVGDQVGRYVGVVVVNYLVFILGVTGLLDASGVPLQVARILAGLCEAVFMYCAMRWLVFRSPRADAEGPDGSQHKARATSSR